MSADATTKLPALHETGDVTLQRGAVIVSNAQNVPMKKLPGKTKPPTLTLDHGKIQMTAAD